MLVFNPTPDSAAHNVSSPAHLLGLPHEIIFNIISRVAPSDIISILLASKTLNSLFDRSLWRHFCLVTFQDWSPKWQIERKIASAASETNWKKLFADRYAINSKVSDILDSILQRQHGRATKIGDILNIGCDARAVLYQYSHATPGDPQGLCKRWHGRSIMQCLDRKAAVDIWTQSDRNHAIRLETALVGFDLFTAEGCRHSLGLETAVAKRLDEIAEAFTNYARQSQVTTEQGVTCQLKALQLVAYLRSHRLVGINGGSEEHYHDLQNNFIGLTLLSGEVSSLPLISATIFCAVARRVSWPANEDETGRGNSSAGGELYLDPWGSSAEINREDLERKLRSMHLPQAQYESSLAAAKPTAIIARCARNIFISVQRGNATNQGSGGGKVSRHAFYAAMWASTLFGDASGNNVSTTNMIRMVGEKYPADSWMVRQYIRPLFDDGEARRTIDMLLDGFKSRDQVPKVSKRRSSQDNSRVKYRVGQVFVHKRYGYQAVIIGWDSSCAASVAWIDQMRVDDLPNGREQSFYHVLVDDESVRYVAQENITPWTGEPCLELVDSAGEYFARWDHVHMKFVSNIRDAYPDD